MSNRFVCPNCGAAEGELHKDSCLLGPRGGVYAAPQIEIQTSMSKSDKAVVQMVSEMTEIGKNKGGKELQVAFQTLSATGKILQHSMSVTYERKTND